MKRTSIKKSFCLVLVIQFVIFSLGMAAAFADNGQEKGFISAENIAVGSEINGDIKVPGDISYYMFTTGKAGTYTVGTTGCTDTYGLLYNENHNLIKKNDDGDSGSNNFSITQFLAANQTYYIAVKHYLDSGTGSYTLRVTSSNILIQMYNESTKDKNLNISPLFRVFNVGKDVLNLSNVKIRYYYTLDSESKQVFTCNTATVGESNVTGKFVKMDSNAIGADCYLEIGFTDGAGTLEFGDYVELQAAITKSDEGFYTQIGDYSFYPEAEDYADWYEVTGYVSGDLCWGDEPYKLADSDSLLYDYIDVGNAASEKEHNLQTSGSVAGEEEKYSVRSTGDASGSWYSFDLNVPAGTDSISVNIRETYYEPCTREYNIYIDGVLLKHYIQTFSSTNIYNIKAEGLSAYTKDGKVTIKFEVANTGENYGTSISDIWAVPAGIK